MARQKAEAQASPQPVSAPTPATDVNALRAQQKALREQIKALKAQTDGEIKHIALDEIDPSIVQVDVRIGDGSRKTEKGQAYLFSADSIRFTTPDGRKWRTGAFYAIADTGKE